MLHLLLPLLGLALCPLQEPGSDQGSPDDPLARFRALDEVDQSTILRGLTRRLQLDPDPVIQRIVSMARGTLRYPVAAQAQWHLASRWAKGVAPKRTLVAADSDTHRRVRSVIPAVDFLPELKRGVWYHWGSGKIVRRAEPLRSDEVFQNLLAGYAPGSDEVVAQILATLDRDPKQRSIASYAEHRYADLDAKVYAEITIYEAWYAEQVLDVPDVDAIPFAVEILKTREYVSPIPAGPARTRLYRRIRDAVFDYRKYRTLREVAAAAFVSADPQVDPTYAPLLPRLHWLYAEHDEDPVVVARKLADLADRQAFLAWADENVQANREAYERREARRKELAGMALKIRQMALNALER